MCGVLLLSSRLLVSWWRVRRLVAGGVAPAVPDWERVTAHLSDALGIRRAVRLLESCAVEVPAVVGSLRPVILLPVSALSGLTTEQIEMVLAHELAHVRRHDFLLNLLQTVVETLLFFHPAVWWMSRQVRIEREHCCDDLAVAVCGDPARYARALARLEELRAEPLPLAIAADGGSLLERIRRLAGQSASGHTSGAQWLAVLGVLTFLLLAIAVPSIPARTSRETTPSTPPAPENIPVEVDVPVSVPVDVPVDIVAAVQNADDNEDVEAPDTAEPSRDLRGTLPTIDELIALKSGGVTPEYLASMRALFPRVTLNQASSLGVMGVTPEYVRAMRDVGLLVLTPDAATSLRAVGVTPEYVREMRAAGLQVTSDDKGGAACARSASPPTT
jgi:hypothetical protein